MNGKFQCPRCKTWTTVAPGTPDFVCDCYKICPDGDKTTDCNVSEVDQTGQMAWPKGLHLTSDDDKYKRARMDYYCSVHNKYYNKAPFLVECDWTAFYNSKLPRDEREVGT